MLVPMSILEVLAAKFAEDLALIDELLALIPAGAESWQPSIPAPVFTFEQLAAHIEDARNGCRACFAKLDATGFDQLTEPQLTQSIPTYFTPEGEPFLAIFLTNWKHLNHHAYQLFTYLKLYGIPVSTRHLYRFR
jgi:hypothetical protein